jgi:formylglycine-generating enzyme required for sulfatase activity
MRCERLVAWSAALVVVTALSCSSSTNTGPVVPSTGGLRAPTDLTLERVSADTIQIAWHYNAENARGIRIERSVGGASSFALRDTVLTALSSEYVDTPLQAGTTYYYRVRAYTGSLISDPSPAVWGIAAADSPPTGPSSPQPPNLAFDLQEGPLTLSWSASDPDGGDQITYDVTFGQTLGGMRTVAQGISAASFTVANPTVANAHYFWQVTVRDTKGAMRIGPLWGFNTRVERVTIPPDSASALFIMGGRDRRLPSGDPNPVWHPGNPVRVGQFDMDKYAVTNQQFADFLNLAIHSNPRQIFITGGMVYDPGAQILYAATNPESQNAQITYDRTDSLFTVIPGKESYPAIEVTWDGAAAYAFFFGRRLPTEAEWEFAARGNAGGAGDSTFTIGPDSSQTVVTVGFGRLYPWGNTLDPRRCNYLGSGDPFEGRGRITSSPVGFFNGLSQGGFSTLDGSSPFGVQDMAGDVWQWCEDWYGPYRNPQQPPTEGLYKIIRGGSWNSGPNSVRSDNRSLAPPTAADWAIGFRTVKSTR